MRRSKPRGIERPGETDAKTRHAWPSLLTYLKTMRGKSDHNFQINFPPGLEGASHFIPSPLGIMERHMALLSLKTRTRLPRRMTQEVIKGTPIASTAWKRRKSPVSEDAARLCKRSFNRDCIRLRKPFPVLHRFSLNR